MLTFAFTDIAGSTRLWERAPDAMREALARHDALIRTLALAHGGRVFKTVVATGFLNNVRSMVTGWYRVKSAEIH